MTAVGRVARWILRVVGWLGLAGLLALVAWTAGAHLHWTGEIVCASRWHLGWLGVPTALALLAGGARVSAGVAATATVWLLFPYLALWAPAGDAFEGGTPLRVVSINLLDTNASTGPTVDWLREVDPDLVCANELDLDWLEALRTLEDVLPHRHAYPDEDGYHGGTFGIAILSKRPLLDVGSHAVTMGVPYLTAEVEVDGERVRVVAAHPMRPGRAHRVAARNETLGLLAEEVRGRPRSLVLGDLNATNTSPAFRDLLAVGELRDSRRGFGRQPTWTSYQHVPGLTFAIDHVLVGADVAVDGRRVGPDLGSDHRPVVADLRVRD